MNVSIAGGHGQIALRLTQLLKERGDRVRSIIRKEEEADDVRAAGGEPVVCDLETCTEDELAQSVGDADAVIFAAGAGPGSGPERKETVDYGGAVKLMDAAKKNGIDRYVMVSSVGADASADGDDTMSVYRRAKGRADDELQKSGLDYTIVRPTRLTDEPGNGQVHIAGRVKGGTIPRDDVAGVLAATLHEPATVGKVFELTRGKRPIDVALKLA